MKKVTMAGFTLALALFAGSSTFHVTFDSDAWIGTSEIKPGDYKVQIEGDKAILKSGKNVIEVLAKLETASHKFEANGVVINTSDNKPRVQEIQIGGTNERIVFSGVSSSTE